MFVRAVSKNGNTITYSPNYLLDVDEILSKIEDKSNNTKKSYLTAAFPKEITIN
eukprot:SAG22_NODE_296_length_12811_cov_14.899780_19_plen_54_part_00